MPATKTIVVLGPDSTNNETLVGSLIYKCGMNMELLRDLEKNGKQQYREIPSLMKQRGLPLEFETRLGCCTVTDDAQSASTFLYLFKITTSVKESLHFLEEFSSTGQRFEKVKHIILLDDMEGTQWSASQFDIFKKTFDGYLQAKPGTQSSWNIIPVSVRSGDNVLELSSKSPWYSAKNDALCHGEKPRTVIEAIDA